MPETSVKTGAAAIELRGLTKRFGHVIAVEDVSLQIPPGQVFGLLGPNGAGKTTTIKMIAGLVTPTEGTARLGGYDIGTQRSQAVQQIGAVLEGSRNVYWSLSAWQNLLYFGRLKGLRGAEIKPRAERLLRDLGLWDRRNELVGGFSRGMQQKVAVAAALVTDPQIVLLDEPTIGLDVEAARTVRQWVVRLARDEGKTIVLTTHLLAMAEELCDRVAVIRDGRIITDLPTGELLDRYVEDRFAVEAARTVRQWVVRLAHDEGKTIVLTTHLLAMAEELCDRVAVIRDGRIITDLPTGELLDRYVEDRFAVEAAGTGEALVDALAADLALESANGRTTIELPTADQDSLHAVLARLHAASVPVLGVSRVQPSLEDVFVSLVKGE